MATTFNFDGRLSPDGSIQLPAEIAGQLPKGVELHVVVMLASSEEDEAWRRLSAERFFAAYDEQDAIYEELLHDIETR